MEKKIFTKSTQLTVEVDVTQNQIYVVKDGRVISVKHQKVDLVNKLLFGLTVK
ncbi:hypothetical protein BAMA111019_16265 [Bacillus manliponensis]